MRYIPPTNRVEGLGPQPTFSPINLWPRLGHKSKGKNKGSVLYSMDENEASKIFIISLYLEIEGATTKF